MSVKVSVKVGVRNARSVSSARSSAHSADLPVMVLDASKAVATPVARGKRNRAKGDSKARIARKRLGIGGVNSRHEELWGGSLRLEVKAGAQIGPIVTRYRAAERQSEAARSHGDVRPFVMVCMPDGESDGLVVMKLSVLGDLMAIISA